MKQILTYLIILTISFIGLNSCSNNGSKIDIQTITQDNYFGTYVKSNDEKQYIELKSNGEFFLQKKMGYVGKYEINGTSITMSTQLGFATKGTISDGVINLGIGKYLKK